MVHLSAPGVRVAGVTSPGIPGVVIGHNDRIAWGFTNVGPTCRIFTSRSLIRRTRRSIRRRRLARRRGSSRADQGPKGFASLEFDTVTHDVTVTRHGPIVFEADGKRYALQWTALDPTRTKPIRPTY
jgi:penicillin amidase